MPSALPDDRPTALAAGFAPPDKAAWLALVERTLKGQAIETLTRRTLDGLAIAPLYEAAATPVLAKATPGWDVRAVVRHPHPAAANAEALQDLAGGANSVLVKIDPSGADGVAVGSADGLARVLDGVLLDVAPVALEAGFLGPQAADWLNAAAKGAPAAALALHLDPLTAFARGGTSPGPVEAHLASAASVAARLAEPYPKASLFLASGAAAHEAGACDTVELAFALAAALAYAKALVRAGLAMDDAFERIVLGACLDADVFVSVAKLRALRRLWARLTGACGPQSMARIEARSSGRMLTRADPWTNMIRLTAAAFAGAVGGADAIALAALTDALGPPTSFARRQARNTQLVLAAEANLGRVVDPGAGSGYVETLTDELARAAWGRFQEIEATGGAVVALEAGLIARWTAESRAELVRRLKDREQKILGVTDFAAASGVAPDVAEIHPTATNAPSARLPGPDGRCPPLAPVRLEDLA
jgi:methylmalonyl-CoA mutase